LRAEERIGKKFNWLTVISVYQMGSGRKTRTFYRCRCRCGKIVDQNDHNLFRVKSCGCYKQSRTTNKVVGRPEYAIWVQMNQRCYNKRCPTYCNYGARGISVCAEWRAKPGSKNSTAVRAFLKYIGPRPNDGRRWTLERKRNSGNYEPGNVRWATYDDQNRNRRGNHLLTFEGKTMVVVDWAKRMKMSGSTILRRLQRGWSVRRTLTTPTEMRGRKVWARDRGLLP
jgi:hypothetical protein